MTNSESPHGAVFVGMATLFAVGAAFPPPREEKEKKRTHHTRSQTHPTVSSPRAKPAVTGRKKKGLDSTKPKVAETGNKGKKR